MNQEVENVSSITWEIVVLGYAFKIGKENCLSRFQVNCLIPSRTDIFPDMHIFIPTNRNHSHVSMKAFLAEIQSCRIFLSVAIGVPLKNRLAFS